MTMASPGALERVPLQKKSNQNQNEIKVYVGHYYFKTPEITAEVPRCCKV